MVYDSDGVIDNDGDKDSSNRVGDGEEFGDRAELVLVLSFNLYSKLNLISIGTSKSSSHST